MTLTLPKFHWPKLPKVAIPKVPRNVAEIAAQGVGVVAVLVGVAAWSAPCAWILGGLTVVLAVERQG